MSRIEDMFAPMPSYGTRITEAGDRSAGAGKVLTIGAAAWRAIEYTALAMVTLTTFIAVLAIAAHWDGMLEFLLGL